MKVFLSHSTKDGDFVKKLAGALDGAGFTPWLCESDIEKGANFVSKINEGLTQSDLALLVWSPDAAKSPWAEQEWTTLLAQQVEEHKIRLAIIVLRDHPRPALLRTSNSIDARWHPADAIRETLEWLRGRQQVHRLSGLRAPVYLPDYCPQDFVGRNPYLTRLQDTLTAEPGVFLLFGEPGAGKSTLALRFAWDAQKDFDAVIFQTCGKRPLDAITAELVERLPIDVKAQPPQEQREAAKAWLRERQSLLVLDDVWSTQVKQLAPGPPCSVLHTSREQSLPWITPKQSARVEKFTEAEAEELFHTYLDSVFGESEVARNREALLGFAARVEWLPIAVAVGASLLREKSAAVLGRAVLKLRVEALTDGAKDVNVLFRTAIEAQPEREQRLVAAGAVCARESFWLPLATEIADLSEDEAEDAADRLVHSSLLRVADRERRRFSLHSLFRDQVRAQSHDDDLSTLQNRHVGTLERLFKDWETRWRECRECLEEIIPAAELLWSNGKISRQAQLSFWGFLLGRRIGELGSALRILLQEESFWEGRNNTEAKAALQRSYGNHALILQAWGRPKEALALHKKEEALALELGNKDQLQFSYGNQANIMSDWGRLEEAQELLKEQEAICLEMGNKVDLQRCYGNQALIKEAWGRKGEALELHKKEEAICLELGNRDELQASYGNQANILRALKRPDEALALLKKQETICLELGNKEGLSKCYSGQGVLLDDLGLLDEAMAMYKHEETICLELGDKEGLQRSYGNQATIMAEWERFEEALDLHKKQEAICLELGNKSGLGYCYWNWALLARDQGDEKTETLKLKQALTLFIELRMPPEREAVKAELDKTKSNIAKSATPKGTRRVHPIKKRAKKAAKKKKK